MLVVWAIKAILQFIGLIVVVWLIFVAGEEYAKIRHREENDNRGP